MCGSGLGLAVVPVLTRLVVPKYSQTWWYAVLFYMGLYFLAGILVSIFPHKKEMKSRQNEVESYIQMTRKKFEISSVSASFASSSSTSSIPSALEGNQSTSEVKLTRRLSPIITPDDVPFVKENQLRNKSLLKHPCFGLCASVI